MWSSSQSLSPEPVMPAGGPYLGWRSLGEVGGRSLFLGLGVGVALDVALGAASDVALGWALGFGWPLVTFWRALNGGRLSLHGVERFPTSGGRRKRENLPLAVPWSASLSSLFSWMSPLWLKPVVGLGGRVSAFEGIPWP